MAYTRPLYLTSPVMYGSDVKEVQTRLSQLGFYTVAIDGYFGAGTKTAVIKFQADAGLSQDGSCGPATWDRMFYLNLTNPQKHGSDVKLLQQTLTNYGYAPGSIDGYFGGNSKNAVMTFQKANSLPQDGSCGPATWNKLFHKDKTSIVKDVTGKLKDLMIRYEYMYLSDWTNKSTVYQLATFYNLVHNKATLDLKNQGWYDKAYFFDNNIYGNDAPGNILYGYLGTVFGYSKELLQRASGYAQAQAGTSNPAWGTWSGNFPYGDDPVDQHNIEVGINFYKKYH